MRVINDRARELTNAEEKILYKGVADFHPKTTHDGWVVWEELWPESGEIQKLSMTKAGNFRWYTYHEWKEDWGWEDETRKWLVRYTDLDEWLLCLDIYVRHFPYAQVPRRASNYVRKHARRYIRQKIQNIKNILDTSIYPAIASGEQINSDWDLARLEWRRVEVAAYVAQARLPRVDGWGILFKRFPLVGIRFAVNTRGNECEPVEFNVDEFAWEGQSWKDNERKWHYIEHKKVFSAVLKWLE